MVFPLHSVSGPGSKQLLNDGIEPISNRLKNQQAVTTLPAGRTGYAGGGGLSASQPRLLGIEVQIFVSVEIVTSTLTSDPTPVEQIKTVRLWAGSTLEMHSMAAFDWHMTSLLHKVQVPEIRQHPQDTCDSSRGGWLPILMSIFILSPIECLSRGCLPRPWDVNDEQFDLWKQIRISIKWPQSNP